MAVADFGQRGEGLLVPEDSAGIVGIAEYDSLGALVDKPLKAFEVHPVLSVLENQRIVHDLPSKAQGEVLERVIDRRLDYYPVARFGEPQIGLVDGCYDPGGIVDPFPRYRIPVRGFHPVPYRSDELFRSGSISHYIPPEPFRKGVPDGRIGPEVHVRYPHGDLAFSGPAPLDAPGSGAVDHLVEIPALTGGIPSGRTSLQELACRQQGSRPGRHHPFKERSSFHCPRFYLILLNTRSMPSFSDVLYPWEK